MNRFPAWKYVLVLVVLLVGALYAAPNMFPEDPAVQVSRKNADPDAALQTRVETILAAEQVPYRSVFIDEGRLLTSFASPDDQVRAADVLGQNLDSEFVVALNTAPRTPGWMRSLGLKPMTLGLDLRGGVHFLLEVDMQAVLSQALQRMEGDFKMLLREEKIRYSGIRADIAAGYVEVELRDGDDLDRAEDLIGESETGVAISRPGNSEAHLLRVAMTDAQLKIRKDFAIEQNITTLRNRVNELGVAEPVVQRQGEARIVVQLPGVQDTSRAKEILGATATVEFRLVDDINDPYEAERRGRAPLGSELYSFRDTGQPILLRREIIVTGDQLTDATQGFAQDDGTPAVFVDLDAKGARKMLQTTRENLNKRMAVVFVENKSETVMRDGEEIRRKYVEKRVINAATIRGVFSNSFQISGLESLEARNLALLLRAGALAAPIDIVEERTVGPSLGQDNIDKGFEAVMIGFLLVIVFMAIYYKGFGLIADVALFVNLVLIVALLSMFQASLTLPGIAGIVLTVGMAVDANVLIFERIREELNVGNTPQASIQAGYEKAFSSIADANVTTLIAAVVLISFGTGPIKGFAVTLAFGIATSMFTAIVGTRALVNLVFGGRRMQTLPI
ncbi:MAG: protein translocase subunit SecD [Gammaproteobacteria bacterium]|nr:protein translocase subunit SecD [Gammaproteobacteria bacterium]